VEVVFDRPGADEELRGDLLVGPSFAGEECDLRLLRSQLRCLMCDSREPLAACCPQLAGRSCGEGLGGHRGEHLVGGSQLGAGVGAAARAAEPFAVEKVCASEVEGNRGAPQPRDRLGIKLLG